MDEPDRLRAQAAPMWEKVKILRNRAFGHRSRAHTTEELFAGAKVKPHDLKELIALWKKLLNVLSLVVRHNTYAFNANATRDTVRLLDDLTKLRAS